MEQIISNLYKLIDKKIELFEEIMRITVRQKEDIEKNSAENIQTLVDEKQKAIDRIDGLDRAFKQLMELLKKQMGINSLEKADYSKYPELAELKHRAQSVIAIATNIMELEEKNMTRLNILYNEVKAELKQINSGKKSVKAYESVPTVTDGIYIDRKK